jgi:hypothetical protein
MLLGSAYLRAGRFVAARQAYDDAMELGQDAGKVALSLALTDIALGHPDVRSTRWVPIASRSRWPDGAWALALAGQADQAVQVLRARCARAMTRPSCARTWPMPGGHGRARAKRATWPRRTCPPISLPPAWRNGRS